MARRVDVGASAGVETAVAKNNDVELNSEAIMSKVL